MDINSSTSRSLLKTLEVFHELNPDTLVALNDTSKQDQAGILPGIGFRTLSFRNTLPHLAAAKAALLWLALEPYLDTQSNVYARVPTPGPGSEAGWETAGESELYFEGSEGSASESSSTSNSESYAELADSDIWRRVDRICRLKILSSREFARLQDLHKDWDKVGAWLKLGGQTEIQFRSFFDKCVRDRLPDHRISCRTKGECTSPASYGCTDPNARPECQCVSDLALHVVFPGEPASTEWDRSAWRYRIKTIIKEDFVWDPKDPGRYYIQTKKLLRFFEVCSLRSLVLSTSERLSPDGQNLLQHVRDGWNYSTTPSARKTYEEAIGGLKRCIDNRAIEMECLQKFYVDFYQAILRERHGTVFVPPEGELDMAHFIQISEILAPLLRTEQAANEGVGFAEG